MHTCKHQERGRSRIRGWGGIPLAFLVMLAGCSTARLDQFSQFATTGQTYTAALPKVLDTALYSTIDANSLELIDIRDTIKDPVERINMLTAADAEILRRGQAFQAIKAQTALLGSYFSGLAALSDTDAGEGIARSTQNAAEALGKISKDAAELKIGKAPVKDVLGEAVPIVVAAFQRAKLEEVLQTTAASVDHSIDIHIALLDKLGEVLRDDQEAALKMMKLNEVDRKFRDPGKLPKEWKTRRAELLVRQVQLGELEEALAAARKLKLAFIDLVENKGSGASLMLLLQDIQRLLALAERISGKTHTEGV